MHPGYTAVPEGDGPFPGVVVVHDAYGMTAELRRVCDHLAAQGYLVRAPSMYQRGRCLRQTFRSLIADQGPAFDRLRTGLERTGVPMGLRVYPEATHSFLAQYTGPLGVLIRIQGMTHWMRRARRRWTRRLLKGRWLGLRVGRRSSGRCRGRPRLP